MREASVHTHTRVMWWRFSSLSPLASSGQHAALWPIHTGPYKRLGLGKGRGHDEACGRRPRTCTRASCGSGQHGGARCLLPFSACSAASRPGVCLVIGSGYGYMCGGGKATSIGARKQGEGDVPIGEREGRDCNATVSSSRLEARVCSCGGDGEEV